MIFEVTDKSGFLADLERVQKLETVLKPPLEKGSDQYTQWVSVLWRETAKINNKVVVRFFETCRKYLDVSSLFLF